MQLKINFQARKLSFFFMFLIEGGRYLKSRQTKTNPLRKLKKKKKVEMTLLYIHLQGGGERM